MRLRSLIRCLFQENDFPDSVTFRVDAGRVKGLSFGHLARCHIISKALKKYWNVETLFIMKDYDDGVRHAGALGETVLPVIDDDLHWFTHASGSLIFDLPDGPSSNALAAAKKKGLWTIVIDDNNNRVPWADIVLNSSILAHPSSYPKEALLLLGPEYLILDECFECSSPKVKEQTDVLEILMTFGGSDPTGLTLKVLKSLRTRKYPKFRFKVVLGPGFLAHSEVIRVAADSPCFIQVLDNPSSLQPLLCDCDLVVCAGGRTLYEATALGLPTIAIATAEHEALTVRAFEQKEMLVCGLSKWRANQFMNALCHLYRSFDQSFRHGPFSSDASIPLARQ